MAFDVEGAKKVGYTDSDIADYLGTENDFDVEGARKVGYGDSDIISHLNQPKEEKSTLGAFAKTLTRVPENLLASGITAVQGGKGPSVTNRGVGDRFVNWVGERNKALAKEYEGTGDVVPGVISKQDVSQLGPNLAFSLVAGAGAVAGGAVTAPVPIPGSSVAGSLAGAGLLAHRMQSYQQMNDWLNKKNEESIKKFGKQISPEEEEGFKSAFDKLATESGLYEAGPEAIGTVLELALLKAKNILPGGKAVPDTLLKKAVSGGARLLGVGATELATESPTQMGQANVEVKARQLDPQLGAGLAEESLREWDNPDDWLKSIKEVLPMVILQAGFLGAGGVAYRKFSRTTDAPSLEIDKQMDDPSLADMKKFVDVPQVIPESTTQLEPQTSTIQEPAQSIPQQTVAAPGGIEGETQTGGSLNLPEQSEGVKVEGNKTRIIPTEMSRTSRIAEPPERRSNTQRAQAIRHYVDIESNKSRMAGGKPDTLALVKEAEQYYNPVKGKIEKSVTPTPTSAPDASVFSRMPDEALKSQAEQGVEGAIAEVAKRKQATPVAPDSKVQQALQKSTPITTSEAVQTKLQTKETLNASLDSGLIAPNSPVRLTTVDELRSIIKKNALSMGEDAEGIPGISAQRINKDVPIVAYGANNKISAAIIFPDGAVESTGNGPNEVKINPATKIEDLRFVIDGQGKVLSYEELKGMYAERAVETPKVETAPAGIVEPGATSQAEVKEEDVGTPKYSTGQSSVPAPITLETVQAAFPGQRIERRGTTYTVTLKNGLTVKVIKNNEIIPEPEAFKAGYGTTELAEGETIDGLYIRKAAQEPYGQIRVTNKGGLVALHHESIHFLEDFGIITKQEQLILDQKVKRDGKWDSKLSASENRAYWLSDVLNAPAPTTTAGKIWAKIREFIDRLVNTFGIRTAAGVVRDVKSGEVYNKPVSQDAGQANQPAYETTPKAVGGITEKGWQYRQEIYAHFRRMVEDSSEAYDKAAGKIVPDKMGMEFWSEKKTTYESSLNNLLKAKLDWNAVAEKKFKNDELIELSQGKTVKGVTAQIDNRKFPASASETGKPIELRAYHGTNETFDDYNTKQIFLSDNPEAASTYAKDRAGAAIEGVPQVRIENLHIKNPLVIDAAGEAWNFGIIKRSTLKAKTEGRDALIVKNIDDFAGSTDLNTHNVIVVLDKSAIGKRLFEIVPKTFIEIPENPAAKAFRISDGHSYAIEFNAKNEKEFLQNISKALVDFKSHKKYTNEATHPYLQVKVRENDWGTPNYPKNNSERRIGSIAEYKKLYEDAVDSYYKADYMESGLDDIKKWLTRPDKKDIRLVKTEPLPNPSRPPKVGGQATEEASQPAYSVDLKRSLSTAYAQFTNPKSLPPTVFKPWRDFLQAQSPKEMSKWDAALSVPFRLAQKYPSCTAAWDAHVNKRQENRSEMTYGFIKTADNFFNIQKNWKKEGLTNKQIDAGLEKVERTLTASNIILHERLVALRSQLGSTTNDQDKQRIQSKIDEIQTTKRFSDEELKAGITDEYGQEIPPLSDREISAYVAARKMYDSVWETQIDHTTDMALLKYKKHKWYNILLAVAGVNLGKEETIALLNNKGLNKAALAYTKKIQPDIQGVFARLDQDITSVPPEELKSVADKYEKQTTALATNLRELQSYIGEITGEKDNHKLADMTREVFSAYLYTRPHLKEIKRLRNESMEWPGYSPQYRDQGKYKIRLVEKFLDEDGNIQTDEQGIPVEPRQVHMEMANTQGEGDKIIEKMLSLYGKDGVFPENYSVEAVPITTSPEAAFQGVNDVNLQKIIDDALSRMKVGETLYDAQGNIVDVYDNLREAAFQSIADQLKARGAMRSTIHRNQKYGVIKGYKERGLQQVALNYLSSMSGLMTKQVAASDMLEILSKEKDPVTFLVLSKWNKEQLRNESQADRYSGIGKSIAFTYMLGGLLKSAVINATQPIIVGIPELKKYMRKNNIKGMAGSVMLQASADVLMGKTSPLETRLMDEAIRKGVAADQYIQSVFEGLSSRTGKKYLAVMRFLGLPFSKVEIHNRLSTMVAMFRQSYPLELKKAQKIGLTGKEAENAAYEAAFNEARTFNGNVNYIYGKANRPMLIQSGDFLGVTGSALYTFKAFPQNFLARQVELFSQKDFRTFFHTMAYMALFGGMMGLPFFKDAFEWFEKHYGYSPTNAVRKQLRGIGGKTLETLGVSGLPAVLGANISGSINIGLPWPIGAANPEESVFGVMGALAKRGQNVGQALGRGDLERAATEASPEFLRAPRTALKESAFGKQFGYQGFATNPRGNIMYDESGKPISLSGKEAALKAIGFNPTDYARSKEENATTVRLETWAAEEKSKIAETFRIARLQKKPDAMKNMMKAVRELNKDIRSRGLQKLVPLTSVSRIIQSAKQVKGMKQRREANYKRAEL